MDFSQYTGPSKEWIALAATLPAEPEGLSTAQLKHAINKGRDEVAAKAMVEEGLKPKVAIRNHAILTRDGSSIEARSFRPSSIPASQPLPVYIHLHGGGFLWGTPDSEDANCSRTVVSLAESGLPVVVVNVNYRHTPEHKYPTAWNDAEDAFHWIHEHLNEIGGEADKVVMGGISAGAWLTGSLVLAQTSGADKRLASRPRLRGQVLMIPCFVHSDFHELQVKQLREPSVSSYVQGADAPILPLTRLNFFTGLLGVEDAKVGDRRLSPGLAMAEEVKGMPPSTFGIAGYDPLRDEGLFYGKFLAENGVPTKVNVFRGLPHGFRRFSQDQLPAGKRWDEVICEGIQFALSDPVATGKFEIISD
ncbi:hypothetical protein ACO22_03388 [Paracoccidioides brasiliensis]|uniref:Alpha/beta hydrolase fold-3 domain-containing protein n=1 Tax=Paracoccidioides brasiliensis TaxID=121759 RepID=A0A1D2JG03_PARBR|nr:hypothetical protein ACO22_03388 [Paracoccidioides brasiliensis]